MENAHQSKCNSTNYLQLQNVHAFSNLVKLSSFILYINSCSPCVSQSVTELGCASPADRARLGTPGVPHFDEPGPVRHGTVTEVGVQGDRARPDKNGIRMNKELDWMEMKLFGNK